MDVYIHVCLYKQKFKYFYICIRIYICRCVKRVRSDLKFLLRDPLPGIYCVPDENFNTGRSSHCYNPTNLFDHPIWHRSHGFAQYFNSVVHCLIVGPFETPYEGGFFYFIINCPDDYPHMPPKVKLMTTGGGTVRFNPNLYASGKTCLSILGTWSGPGWVCICTSY
jgi:hypothetical protein